MKKNKDKCDTESEKFCSIAAATRAVGIGSAALAVRFWSNGVSVPGCVCVYVCVRVYSMDFLILTFQTNEHPKSNNIKI